jgi:hypothetical protein
LKSFSLLSLKREVARQGLPLALRYERLCSELPSHERRQSREVADGTTSPTLSVA